MFNLDIDEVAENFYIGKPTLLPCVQQIHLGLPEVNMLYWYDDIYSFFLPSHFPGMLLYFHMYYSYYEYSANSSVFVAALIKQETLHKYLNLECDIRNIYDEAYMTYLSLLNPHGFYIHKSFYVHLTDELAEALLPNRGVGHTSEYDQNAV